MRVSAFIAVLFFVLSVFPLAVSAQNVSGLAINVELADQEAGEGDIISATDSGFTRSSVSFDEKMYGVVASTPIISYSPKTDKTKPIVTSGATHVRVSAKDAAILVGDLITTSEEAGVGKKATGAGFVLGKALEAWEDSSKVGLINVEVGVFYAQGSLAQATIGNLFNSLLGSADSLRYILAAVVGILAFIFSFIAFLRFVSVGLAALGRNPLAKRTIYSGMVISGSLVTILTIGGLGVAAAIIFLGR